MRRFELEIRLAPRHRLRSRLVIRREHRIEIAEIARLREPALAAPVRLADVDATSRAGC
jgi:hypothetical protein